MNESNRIEQALRPFLRPRLWLGLWLLGWMLCIVLSLVSAPLIELEIPQGDKLEHFLVYGTLSAWAVAIFDTRRARWIAAASLVTLGVAMELAQGQFTVDRMMDARDAVANTIGVALGQLLALAPAQSWLQRLDARLFR